MKRRVVILASVAVLGAAVSASLGFGALSAPSAVTKQRSGFLQLPPAAPAGQIVLYGHIKTLSRKNGRFELGFDPAWLTTGLTASRAKLADTGSSDVPNDSYVVDDGHRLLTYIVPTTARITVLTNDGTGISSTPIAVSELARMVNGGKHRKLFEPLESGIWIRVHVDAVLELDQQYHP